MAFYNLIGRRGCYRVGKKTVYKHLNTSILALIRFFVRVLIEIKVNISNELNFSDVYQSVNYTGLLAKFT